MIGIYLLIGVVIIIILLKGSKTKNSHETINEKNVAAIKNKEILKEKIQNDLKNNKIDHVFVEDIISYIHNRGEKLQEKKIQDVFSLLYKPPKKKEKDLPHDFYI